MPSTPKQWLSEIAVAYLDAQEAKPFGIFVGQKMTENDLFHMAPAICLKARGIKAINIDKATEAMLSSYIGTKDQVEDVFRNPYLLFGFAYLASHFGMELLAEEKVSEIMEYLEEHQQELGEHINNK